MKQKDLVFLLASTAILVLAWIAFSVYYNLRTSTIPENINTQITPIQPVFDKKTLEALKQREKTVPVYKVESEPTPIQSGPTPIGSPSAESSLTEAEQATQGGGLSP
ncbi:MAG: hypothetical protein HYU49_00625 [Candidatus Levybacteria bacterium]|nr:hypothetical protein [Candidatus Levybacteria bacterium]MBI2190027.1 hypothetical protein [Candidatus Levybacteria bacterium]